MLSDQSYWCHLSMCVAAWTWLLCKRWRLSVSLQGPSRQEGLRLSRGVAGKETGKRKKRFLICNVCFLSLSVPSHLPVLYSFNPLLPISSLCFHPLLFLSFFQPSLSLPLFSISEEAMPLSQSRVDSSAQTGTRAETASTLPTSRILNQISVEIPNI